MVYISFSSSRVSSGDDIFIRQAVNEIKPDCSRWWWLKRNTDLKPARCVSASSAGVFRSLLPGRLPLHLRRSERPDGGAERGQAEEGEDPSSARRSKISSFEPFFIKKLSQPFYSYGVPTWVCLRLCDRQRGKHEKWKIFSCWGESSAFDLVHPLPTFSFVQLFFRSNNRREGKRFTSQNFAEQ